jgi:hypothetical protein
MFGLKPEQYFLFLTVHVKHLKTLESKERQMDLSLKNIKEVIWDEEEDCLKVYYRNGDWWHYTKSEEWY